MYLRDINNTIVESNVKYSKRIFICFLDNVVKRKIMNLFSTNENGKIKTHVHNGQGHSVCGTADDIFEEEEFTLDRPKHDKITCSKCKEQIRYILKLAKKYGIK